jgi:uncharacterized protein YerC
MTKLSRRQLDPEKFGQYINNLWSAFVLMDSKQDIKLLFMDLFTHTEYKMFAKRLEIARQLLEKVSYQDIQRNLSVTPNTVNRVSNILIEKGDGLKKVHEKLSRLEEKYLAKQKEIRKNTENPFRQKVINRQKTVLGEVLKGGLSVLDKTISKKLKQRTARKTLEV